MVTPNKIIPHRGRIFQNPKTHLLFYSFKKRVAPIGGSGESPQIGDSTGDRTQNLWFHKRIKLELELGILEHMVL